MAAESTSQPLAANILGTIGTVLWCIQLIPQIWYNWRKKDTAGLPALMMFIWAACAIPFGAYAIIQDLNIPVQCQAQIFGFLSILTFCQCLHYYHKYSTLRVVLIGAFYTIVAGGLEALLILTVRPLGRANPDSKGYKAAVLTIGVVAGALLAFGLIPPFFEIAKRRGRVVGINFVFLATDWFGAFFSLMSLAAQREFDVMGGVLYILCLLLEGGIFGCHIVWVTRRWMKKRRGENVEEDEEGIDKAAELEEGKVDEPLAEEEAKRPERDGELPKYEGDVQEKMPTIFAQPEERAAANEDKKLSEEKK